jgi:hypothetical protein
LGLGLDIVQKNFELLSTKKVNCRGKEQIDPTVYLGTAGISYGLLRAAQAEEAMPPLVNEGSEENKVAEEEKEG